MQQPGQIAGITVEAVEWLPSDGESDLVRVRGRAESPLAVLPHLAVRDALLQSLPDPRTGLEPEAWRGAYLVPSALMPPGRWSLVWPDGRALALPPPQQGLVPDAAPRRRPADPAGGGEVVDRVVLAERRARRAEAAEQAQARIAAQAMKALELLEKRGAELERRLEDLAAERDVLLRQADESAGLRGRLAEAEARLEMLTTEHAAEVAQREGLEDELTAARQEAEQLRGDLARIEATVLERRERELPQIAPELERPAPAPPSGDLVADLDRAAEDLRRRFVAGAPGVPEEEAPAPEEGPQPPPRLRQALARMAREEPEVAVRLLVGLLGAQGPLLAEPLRYDLTIRGFATYGIDADHGHAEVSELARPRRGVDFHLTARPEVLAEMMAGERRELGYFTRGARLKGRASDLVADLWKVVDTGMTLEEAVRAGARLDPEPVYRALPYVIDPEWTRGHSFTVAQQVAGEGSWYVTVDDGAPVEVRDAAPEGAVAATVTMSRATFDRLLRREPPAPGERPSIRGDHRAVELLRSWTERARESPAASRA